MLRFTVPALAAFLLATAAPSFAAPAKRPRAKAKSKAARVASQTPAAANSPFADVPAGHWAYAAIAKTVEAGVLQGWDSRFHGNKIVNRYMMAVIVARMVDRLGVMRAAGREFTGRDIANIEALTIEFADELALLNVKVAALDATLTGIGRDLDLFKADIRSGGGARAGISGTVQARAVFTSDGGPGWGSDLFRVRNPVPAATTGLLRYHGGAVSGSGTLTDPYRYDSRQFGTVSNFAVNFDRQFDPHVHFHAQLDLNAEGSQDSTGTQTNLSGYAPDQPLGTLLTATPGVGRGENFAFSRANILVNEAYVTWVDSLVHDIAARAGIWALPMNTEVNGPSRTYQWTITPSVANAKWESLRPVGLDVFRLDPSHAFTFHAGVFSPADTTNGVPRSGTLLSAPTAFSATPLASNLAPGFSQLDGLTNPAGTAFGFGRFPTPLSSVMTDGARGVEGQTLSGDRLGFYGMVGAHPTHADHRGLTWQAAYFDRNGDLRPGADNTPSLTDWSAWQGAASYQFKRVALAGQYYDASSRNYATFEVLPGADARRLNTTPFVNAGGEDTNSRSVSGLVNVQLSRRANGTFRYEKAKDETGPARVDAEICTAAFNWRASDHSWLQLEGICTDAESRSENGVANDVGLCDRLLQLNYKANW